MVNLLPGAFWGPLHSLVLAQAHSEGLCVTQKTTTAKLYMQTYEAEAGAETN